ncbi:MAG: DNA repair protein RecN [Bacteroidota bacterium]
MLTHLSIQNYALIERLEIDFAQGLTTITGETGAGKSILLGALGLVLGQRADVSVLSDKERKCIVEADFDVSKYQLQSFFDTHDLEYDKHTIIRREILSSGKSRAFLNDSPVTLTVLKLLANTLIDIHSQHEHLLLGSDDFQLEVVDIVAETHNELASYKTVYATYKDLQARLRQLREIAGKAKADADYNRFQWEQLEKAKLQEGELQELETELETLAHTEEIKQQLALASTLLDGDQLSLVQQVKEGAQALHKIEGYFRPAAELFERLESAHIELQDIAGEIEQHAETLEHDPERLTFVRERVDLYYSLMQKHGAQDIRTLIEMRDRFHEAAESAENIDEQIGSLEKDLAETRAQLKKAGNELTTKRKKSFKPISEHLSATLQQLGMPNGRIEVKPGLRDDFGPKGQDVVQFVFSANRHVPLEPLSKVASGGEMSRVMLSLKAMIAKKAALPTIIFDEIDAGTSGEIANKIGLIIQQMGQHMQVLNITHLPQIASKGQQHVKVYKTEGEERTATQLKVLTKQERLHEIAQMLSGDPPTDAAYENARELLAIPANTPRA